jgi:hypothetical protein
MVRVGSSREASEHKVSAASIKESSEPKVRAVSIKESSEHKIAEKSIRADENTGKIVSLGKHKVLSWSKGWISKKW